MSSRTRSSRATMPITSTLPPWELTMTSLRRPARCTLSPISHQMRMRLSAENVMVPGERRCSCDFPIVWIGRNSTRRSSGRRARTVSIMPCAIAVSVMTGRCGPCCSVAAIGRMASVVCGSSAANSLDFSSDQKRLAAMLRSNRRVGQGAPAAAAFPAQVFRARRAHAEKCVQTNAWARRCTVCLASTEYARRAFAHPTGLAAAHAQRPGVLEDRDVAEVLAQLLGKRCRQGHERTHVRERVHGIAEALPVTPHHDVCRANETHHPQKHPAAVRAL